MAFKKPRISYEVVDEIADNDIPFYDSYIRAEAYKYTLREWRRWTRDIIIVSTEDEDMEFTRAEYSTNLITHVASVINQKGYHFIHKLDSVIRRFMHHWYNTSISSINKSYLIGNMHNYTQEEYEEWEHDFPDNFWNEVGEYYRVYMAFDDTDVGKQLFYDLPVFFWQYVDIVNSPKFIEMREANDVINRELGNIIDDTRKGYNTTNDNNGESRRDKIRQAIIENAR